jgi:hypothetical protein
LFSNENEDVPEVDKDGLTKDGADESVFAIEFIMEESTFPLLLLLLEEDEEDEDDEIT